MAAATTANPAAAAPELPDDHYRITYEDIHLHIAETAKQIRATFSPDLMVAIGGGGFFPARVLRTFLKREGGNGKLVNVPIQAIGLSLYEDLGQAEKQKESAGPSSIGKMGIEVVRTQWLDAPKREGKDGITGGLLGKNILIVVRVRWEVGKAGIKKAVMLACLLITTSLSDSTRTKWTTRAPRSDTLTTSCSPTCKRRLRHSRPSSAQRHRQHALQSLSCTTSCAPKRVRFPSPGPTSPLPRSVSRPQRQTVATHKSRAWHLGRRLPASAKTTTGPQCPVCGTLQPRQRVMSGLSSA